MPKQWHSDRGSSPAPSADKAIYPAGGPPVTARPERLVDPDADDARGLARYLDVFEAPDFEFGQWTPMTEGKDGVLTLAYYTLSDDALGFVSTAYKLGWVYDVDWMAWIPTPEGQALYRDRAALADASTAQIAKLLTALIRSERFGDGTLADAYDSGLLAAILRRVSTLADGGPKPS